MKKTLIAILALGGMAMAEGILDNAVTKVYEDNDLTTISLTDTGKSGSFTLTMQLNEAGVALLKQYVGSTTASAGNPSVVSLEGAAGSNKFVGTAFGYSSSRDGSITDGGIFLTAQTSGPTTSGGSYQSPANYLTSLGEDLQKASNVCLTLVHTDRSRTDLYGIVFDDEEGTRSFSQSAAGLKWSNGLGTWSNLHINTTLVSKVALYDGVLTSEQIAESNRAILSMSKPVPEPATGSLSLLALAGLCARRRRK